MKKVFLQDVMPAGKRSIRNIPLPTTRSSPGGSRPKAAVVDTAPVSERGSRNTSKKAPAKPQASAGFPKFAIWSGAVVALLGFIYVGSFFFVSATVNITPKKVSLPINSTLSANLEDAEDAAAIVDSGLSYSLVTLSAEASKELPATGKTEIKKKATGKITIFNNNSKDAQKLVANTRFETPSGLIFRLVEPVSVPGQKIVSGVLTPGSVTVTVLADQPGEKYNVGLSDFTIPGFKGDPKYQKITAKSDPKFPIKDGLIGSIPKVAPADAASAKVSIETQLKNQLKDDLQSQIPASHVLFNNSTSFSFEEITDTLTPSTSVDATAPETATIKEKGSIYGIIFDRKALSKYLAEHSSQIGQKDVSVTNLDSLNFTQANKELFDPLTSKTVNFTLTGEPDFTWNVDGKAVAESLAGQKRANIKAILSKFEFVGKANIAINPFWIFTIPENIEKIHVKVD